MTAILDKSAFSTDSAVAIVWGTGEGLSNFKILILFWPTKNGISPLTFIDPASYVKRDMPRKKFPTLMSNRKVTQVSSCFRFTENDLSKISSFDELKAFLDKKIGDTDRHFIDTMMAQMTSKHLLLGRVKLQGKQKKKKMGGFQNPRAHIISAGLYGLGKNRRH